MSNATATPVSPAVSPRLALLLAQSRKLAESLSATAAEPAASGDPLTHASLEDLLERLGTQTEDAPALFAWLTLRATFSAARAAHLYDELQLRTGFAQIFPAFGLQGEQAWRAAAQVRLLLLADTTPLSQVLGQDAFWSSSDTHWLAGVDSTATYINKEAFESLLHLLAFPSATPASIQRSIITQAQKGGYKIASLQTPQIA